MPGIANAIAGLNRRDIPVVVVTNQSAVARGLITEPELHKIHRHLAALLAEENAVLDAIYYCPHHPDAGYPPYKIACECRKPAPGMILQAARDHRLDLPSCVFIGDTLSDIEAAQRADVGHTILVRTGHGTKEAALMTGSRFQPHNKSTDTPSAIRELIGDDVSA